MTCAYPRKLNRANPKTGILSKTNTTDDLNVFPNPFNNIVSIDVKRVYNKQLFVEVIDLHNRVLYKKGISSSKHIDLSELNKGIYFLRVHGENFTQTKKIIKH